MKKIMLILFVFVFIFSVSVFPSSAYDGIYDYKIETPLVFTMYEGFDNTTKANMRLAAQKWCDELDGFDAILVSSYHNDYGYPNVSDSISRIYRYPIEEGYVGYARTYYTNGVVDECDIDINVYHNFANSAQPGTYDVYSVILHEFGHALGLKDLSPPYYSYSSAVMYGEAIMNTTKRDLTAVDIFHISLLYGLLDT